MVDIVEDLKQQIFQVSLFEANQHYDGYFSSTFDEIKCILLDNKLTIVFPPTVETENISPEYQKVMAMLVPELKRFMYDMELGVWISFSLMFNIADDSFLFLFNYDEPVDLYSLAYNDEAYAKELSLWPRHDKYIPSWWRNRISYL